MVANTNNFLRCQESIQRHSIDEIGLHSFFVVVSNWSFYRCKRAFYHLKLKVCDSCLSHWRSWINDERSLETPKCKFQGCLISKYAGGFQELIRLDAFKKVPKIFGCLQIPVLSRKFQIANRVLFQQLAKVLEPVVVHFNYFEAFFKRWQKNLKSFK